MAQPIVVALVCSTLVFIHFGRAAAVNTGWGRALRLGKTWELSHLRSCHLGKYPWEVAAWEKFFGKEPNVMIYFATCHNENSVKFSAQKIDQNLESINSRLKLE